MRESSGSLAVTTIVLRTQNRVDTARDVFLLCASFWGAHAFRPPGQPGCKTGSGRAHDRCCGHAFKLCPTCLQRSQKHTERRMTPDELSEHGKQVQPACEAHLASCSMVTCCEVRAVSGQIHWFPLADPWA